MKTFIITVLVFVAFLALTAARQNPARPNSNNAIAKSEIEKIERDRNQAIVNGDAGALDRMTSDDYTFIN